MSRADDRPAPAGMTPAQMIEALDRLCGAGEGLRVYTTVVPGILADFRRMLSRVPAGTPVREEYRLEDGSAVIFVSGCRRADGTVTIDMNAAGN